MDLIGDRTALEPPDMLSKQTDRDPMDGTPEHSVSGKKKH
jgi:hypothetical protein